MSLRTVVCLVGALAACSDDRCIEGVCPDWSETRKLPGPCRGAATSLGPIEFAYDGDRVTHAGFHVLNELGNEQFVGSDWFYDDAGAVKQIDQRRVNFPTFTTYRWTFDGETVQAHGSFYGGYIFDAATFAFLPHVGRDLAAPDAELGLIELRGVAYEWTTEGSRRIRRSIPTVSHPESSTATFELDDRDRILSISHDRESDGVPNRVDRFVYDGDLLVHQDRARTQFGYFPTKIDWTYDLGGNVVEGTSESYREVFAYDCW